MKIPFTPMWGKKAGFTTRLTPYDTVTPHSGPLKWDSGTTGSLLDLSFCESYARQCLHLVQWDYLRSQVIPVSAYRMAMAQEIVVSRKTEAVDYGMGGYFDRSLGTSSREVQHLESPPEVAYCKGWGFSQVRLSEVNKENRQ